jgi:hypothetical protein
MVVILPDDFLRRQSVDGWNLLQDTPIARAGDRAAHFTKKKNGGEERKPSPPVFIAWMWGDYFFTNRRRFMVLV